MKVCYFGDYDPCYSRTKVIHKGLEQAGVSIVQCHTVEKGWRSFVALWSIHRTLHGEYDVMVVGQGGRMLPILARLLTKKPLVWEPLFSLYDSWIFDRKLASPYSIKALWYWFLDWIDCLFVDLVILDTEEHTRYFHKTFGIPERKLAHVLVGADTTVFHFEEKKQDSTPFEIEFHGKYIPVQGPDVLVRAAALLLNDNVHITMIGGGQMHRETQQMARALKTTNITFLPFLPQKEVAQYIVAADATIGLLGDVPRVRRAIPNKLYESAATGRVTISADTPALREVFTPGVDVIGVRQGDPESIAHAIRALKASGQASTLGRAAYATFVRKASVEVIGIAFLCALKRVAW